MKKFDTKNGLAIVGFIALVAAGMWLAVSSTRFVPPVVNRIGAAAVYLGSIFTPAPKPDLSVVSTPTASTTIPFGAASSVLTSSPQATSTPSEPATTAVNTTKTTNTYQISGASVSAPSGLSDLVVNINAVGYLETTSVDSFVASSTIPAGSRPAVKFTIKNIGTNWTGTWRFNASIPTWTTYVYQSQPQQSLAPGDSIDYTLGFDRANAGADKIISITANFDRAVTESNTNNNNASTKVTILGS